MTPVFCSHPKRTIRVNDFECLICGTMWFVQDIPPEIQIGYIKYTNREIGQWVAFYSAKQPKEAIKKASK